MSVYVHLKTALTLVLMLGRNTLVSIPLFTTNVSVSAALALAPKFK